MQALDDDSIAMDNQPLRAYDSELERVKAAVDEYANEEDGGDEGDDAGNDGATAKGDPRRDTKGGFEFDQLDRQRGMALCESNVCCGRGCDDQEKGESIHGDRVDDGFRAVRLTEFP